MNDNKLEMDDAQRAANYEAIKSDVKHEVGNEIAHEARVAAPSQVAEIDSGREIGGLFPGCAQEHRLVLGPGVEILVIVWRGGADRMVLLHRRAPGRKHRPKRAAAPAAAQTAASVAWRAASAARRCRSM